MRVRTRQRATLAAAVAVLLGATAAAPARAQSQGDIASMSCADYIKAETASGWSQGVTGRPGIDRLSAADTAKLHDFCASHPGSNVRDAIQQVQSK